MELQGQLLPCWQGAQSSSRSESTHWRPRLSPQADTEELSGVLSVLTMPRGCSVGHPESRRALVPGSHKRLNTMKLLPTPDLHRTQVSVFSLPLSNSRSHHQLQVVSVTSALAVPYKGLLEYCCMSCLWQASQTRSGLMLEGRGSSLPEQDSQKMPPQFLQMFFLLPRLLSSRQSWQTSALPGPESCSCSSCVLLGALCGRMLFSSLRGCFSLGFSSWLFSFPSCLSQFFVLLLVSWLCW